MDFQNILTRKEYLLAKKDCQKVKFRSRAEAKSGMKRANRKHKNNPKFTGITDYYLCRNCGAWHLTSMPIEVSRNLNHWRNKNQNS